MNYQEAVDFISSTYKFGIKLGLENISRLLDRLGNPQDKMKIVHIAGTNGKGSTSAILSSIFVEAGYKTGLYTSPFLEVFNERFKINNENASDELIAKATEKVKKEIDQLMAEGYDCPSEFEVTTAVGFVIFQMEEVEVLVLEVGMGGRLDATNAINNPLLSIIVSISKDHVEYLGDTIGKIAFEKAGIIKENTPLVLYPQEKEGEEIILKVAEEKNAPVFNVDFSNRQVLSSTLEGQVFSLNVLGQDFKDLKISILGDHQLNNATTALTTVKVLNDKNLLKVSDSALRTGLEKAKWAGRFEIMRNKPLTIIDGAHNIGGAEVFSNSVKEYLKDYEITLVMGILGDKDFNGVLDLLLPLSKEVVTVRPDSPRALEPEKLAEIIKDRCYKATPATSIENAWDLANEVTNRDKGAILFVGSLYMIGQARTFLKNL